MTCPKREKILLMEDILHHPTCMKQCKSWDKRINYLSTGAGFLPSTVPQPKILKGCCSHVATKTWVCFYKRATGLNKEILDLNSKDWMVVSLKWPKNTNPRKPRVWKVLNLLIGSNFSPSVSCLLLLPPYLYFQPTPRQPGILHVAEGLFFAEGAKRPSRELSNHTIGKEDSSSELPSWRNMLVPSKVCFKVEFLFIQKSSFTVQNTQLL